MAEESVTISVMTDVDLGDLQELEDLLSDIEFQANSAGMTIASSFSDIDTSGVDNVGSSATDAADEVEKLGESGDGIPQIGENADNASESLDGLGESASNASGEVDGIKGDSVEKTGESANNTSSDMDTLASSAAGVGSAMGLEKMVDTAGNISDSWNRLGLTFGTVTPQMKADISSAAASTGRSGGTVRGYFNMMGIAGIKNSNLLSSSFQSIAGKAYQLNKPIEQVESSVQRMVLTGKAGTRQLTSLGLSADQLGAAMGVTGDQAADAFSKLSQEERLKVLTKAMGDGTKANNDYKTSWAGVKEKGAAAMAGLLGAIGGPMLSVMIPALTQLTNLVNLLSDAFKILPGPVQSVIGGVLALGMGFIALVGVLGMVGKAFNGIRTGLQTLGLVGKATEGANAFQQLKLDVQSVADNIKSKLKSALDIAKQGFESLKSTVSTVATNMKTMLSDAFNKIKSSASTAASSIKNYLSSAFNTIKTTVMSAASTIRTTLTSAVNTAKTAFSTMKTAVISAATSLKGYVTSAWASVTASVQSALASIRSALAKVMEALHTAYDTIVKGLNAIATYALAIAEYLLAAPILLVVIAVIAAVAILIYLYTTNTQVKATVDWLIAAFWNFLATVGAVFMGAVAWVMNFATSVWAWLMNGWNAFLSFLGYLASFPGRLWGYLMSAIQKVISFCSSFVSNLRSGATRGVSSFINGIITLGSRVYSELQGTLNKVIEWGSQIVSKFGSIAQQAWSAFVNGLGIGSPGYIAINTEQELKRVADHADDYGGTFQSKFEALGGLASNSYLKGNQMVTSLPNTGNNVSAGGNTINITVQGNVKDDATIDKIVAGVTKALSWNNTLAGRTIGDTIQ